VTTEDCISNFEVTLIYEPIDTSLKSFVDSWHARLKEASKKKGFESSGMCQEFMEWAIEACYCVVNVALLLSIHTKKTLALNLDWFFVDSDNKVKFLLPIFQSVMKPLSPLEFDAVFPQLTAEARWCYEGELKDSQSQAGGATARRLLNYAAGVIVFYVLFGEPPFGKGDPLKKKRTLEESKPEAKWAKPDRTQHYEQASIEYTLNNSVLLKVLDRNQSQIARIVELVMMLGDLTRVSETNDSLANFDPLLELLSLLDTCFPTDSKKTDLEVFLRFVEEHPCFLEKEGVLQQKAYLPSNLVAICDNSKRFKLFQILFDDSVIMDLHRPSTAASAGLMRKHTLHWQNETGSSSVGFLCKFYYSELTWLEASFSLDNKPISVKLLVDDKKNPIKDTIFNNFLSDTYRIRPIDTLIDKWTSFLSLVEKKESKESHFAQLSKSCEVFDEYRQQPAFDVADLANDQSRLG
jgi:hypothetical protein